MLTPVVHSIVITLADEFSRSFLGYWAVSTVPNLAAVWWPDCQYHCTTPKKWDKCIDSVDKYWRVCMNAHHLLLLGWSLMINLLQSLPLQCWVLVKDFENRLINGEVMGKSRVSFYDSRGTLAMINKIWHSFSVHLEPVAKFRIYLLQPSAPWTGRSIAPLRPPYNTSASRNDIEHNDKLLIWDGCFVGFMTLSPQIRTLWVKKCTLFIFSLTLSNHILCW